MARSITAASLSVAFRLWPKKHTDEEWRCTIDELKAQPEGRPRAPRGIDYRLDEGPAGRVFYLNEGGNSRYTVFFIHGGTFIWDFSQFHWSFVKKLVRRTGAEVVAPAYSLVPHGTFREALDLIVPLYDAYVAEHPDKKIIIMGDSAGGGLALSLALQLAELGMRLPDELVVFSPVVDVTLSNPDILDYVKDDPCLTLSQRVPMTAWAGDESPDDWRVSPINGDLAALRNVTLFTGTHELLYPDELRLAKALAGDSSNELIVGKGMSHIYPFQPIPEAKPAFDLVVRKVLR